MKLLYQSVSGNIGKMQDENVRGWYLIRSGYIPPIIFCRRSSSFAGSLVLGIQYSYRCCDYINV